MTKRPDGQIRRSQLVGTFGPGAMADLPNHSVLIAGLDHWSKGGDEVMEPRLVTKLQDLLQVSNLKLMLPPPDQEDPTAPPTGVTAWQFPEWFITQYVELADRGSSRSRMLIHRTALSRGKYIDDNKKRQPVVPIRFVQACRRGHISDISWKTYVHRGRSDCTRNLWIDERGTSGDISEVWVRCECGQERPVGEAAYGNGHPLGQCDGHRPWLGPYTREDCTEPNRLLIRNASNAYFPQQMSVISLPDRDEAVAKAVDQVWEHYLKFAEDIEELKYERKKKEPVSAALEGFADDVVFAEIQKRRGGTAAPLKSVKLAEFETLSTAADEIGEDRPGGDFFARTLPRSKWDKRWMGGVERIVLVHRLREVVALAGFTRFEPSSPNVEGELDLAVEPARLAREPSWLPAIENKGEGIFIQLKTAAVDAWLARPQVQERGRHLLTGFGAWATEHAGSKRKFFGLPYVMLHSLSHLLITSVSLECGYPASSIKERIYSLPGTGYGLLLHTGTSDSEGTLGGLIEVGRRISDHIRAALEMGRLCSNDPVCAQHDPANMHERRFLHGASCHGCLLIAETSCEQHNEFLDRALVVPTVEALGSEFFGGE